jgi:predicted dehydrogenase
MRNVAESVNVSAGTTGTVKLGVVGLGAFGRFCLEAYLGMPEVRVMTIADVEPRALDLARRLAPEAQAYDDAMALLASPEVEVVALCAPPDRSLALVRAAALAGKHILCDKPLGISLAEFDAAVAAASAHGVSLGINLVLRHNSLYSALYDLAHSGALGWARRVAVENYADEAMGFGPEHWLWNPSHSGGLALAADIHWLDVATRLLGPAHEVSAWGTNSMEGVGPRRLITTAHDRGAVASVYHAFDTNPSATGCTVLAAFDGGEARIDGWIPTRLTVRCPADRVAAVAAVLGATALPEVSIGDDDRAALVARGPHDRRTEYLEMIRASLRLVVSQARGEAGDSGLSMARVATATALAAECAAVSRGWVDIGPENVAEAAS